MEHLFTSRGTHFGKWWLTCLLACLLTPCSRFVLQKLTGSQVVKKFPSLYGTRRFIAAFTRASYLSLSRTISIKSILSHPTSWRSIL